MEDGITDECKKEYNPCKNKNDDSYFKDNTIVAVIKTNGVTFEITNTATSDFIKNLIEAFNHA